MTVVMDARELFEQVLNGIRQDVKMLQENRGVTPGLAALLVGDDPVSQTYVSLKEKDCGKVGFVSRVYKMFDYPPETREKEVLNLLRNLNTRG